ncbi:MAG: zinc-dependent peptidase [Ardenticatenaceae bacterium]|nr:zinc-dependent peptidase [Anaerolineales bacterium]MCB8920286.1 zinc-dependent peptidase [Ardenticatenaceae bacterium]
MFERKEKRRQRLRERPFPTTWAQILEQNVTYYRQLTPEEQAKLRGHIQVFLDENPFEGCGGLEINDEIRVTIAAEACILLLHRETDYYPDLRSILVYPHPYRAPHTRHMPGGIVVEGIQGRLGESWERGYVVLSWDEVQRTAHNHADAHNVVFHEFAHQLDSQSGGDAGVPTLPNRAMYAAWVRVMGSEYEHLLHDLERHHKSDLDAYGATNPAEFFAVITEAFFEKPLPLQHHHPQLYDLLASFYQQDPAARFRKSKS